jgi:hypothetical protein
VTIHDFTGRRLVSSIYSWDIYGIPPPWISEISPPAKLPPPPPLCPPWFDNHHHSSPVVWLTTTLIGGRILGGVVGVLEILNLKKLILFHLIPAECIDDFDFVIFLHGSWCQILYCVFGLVKFQKILPDLDPDHLSDLSWNSGQIVWFIGDFSDEAKRKTNFLRLNVKQSLSKAIIIGTQQSEA